MIEPLVRIEPGTRLLVGGDRVVTVPPALAARFAPGDAIAVVEATGEVLHLPAEQRRLAGEAVRRAHTAFGEMGNVDALQISCFFHEFAARLEADDVWEQITRINAEDIADARRRGRSTTRLVADEKLRRGMIEGLRNWTGMTSRRGEVLESIEHPGWNVDLVGAELGVVGFVFEGRPNVVADATGVLRGGNTVVFRIGRDALRTARAIMDTALAPALREARMPEGAVSLVDSSEHAAGWSLFSDRRLSLAVARGSGPAVTTLGALARQAGIPASLHGTGGAWIVASPAADARRFNAVVRHSLDRKVCNTLNVCCIDRSRGADLVEQLLRALEEAGCARGQQFKLHVVEQDREFVPRELFDREITVRRAEGDVLEKQAVPIAESELGHEWEWEETPEITLKIVDSIDEAIELFNRYSPQFVASLISEDAGEHERFFRRINAPFVGDGFTRWVDGQYALDRPELGLSNWQNGRLLARGGVLSGDSVYTIRARVRQTNADLKR